MQLTWPQFEYISLQIHKLQYQRAKNEVFFGIAAALGGNQNKLNLIQSAGGFVEQEQQDSNMAYTAEDYAYAMARLNKIIEQQKAAEQEQKNV